MENTSFTARTDLYQAVTDKIISALESGVTPWKCPWQSANRNIADYFPRNGLSHRFYSGVNVLLLWLAARDNGYQSPGWLTFRQANEAGGNVRKGERASLAIFFKPYKTVKKNGAGIPVLNEQGEPVMEERTVIKHMPLFNIEQCENLPETLNGSHSPTTTTLPVAEHNTPEILALVNALGIPLQHRPQNRAFYRPATDTITLPMPDQFVSTRDYQATLLHELTHATGHQQRLAREGIVRKSGRFGDPAYAFEELIAEIGSAFLLANFNISGEVQHASYINGWLKVLKEDKHAIFRACRQAREACDFLLNMQINQQRVA
ncbi:DUF1738 domain-containing protein [Salmonella enterica subsp. enterica]|nr:DUF1738 domain-containing protein [Salmonella enterica subsp. enterica]MIF51098.1 DUF1738 domain-containing protein [Salmonella enterica subsp. enterica]